MSATILDVARSCRLSPGLVRRVLSAAGADVGDELRARILTAARELELRIPEDVSFLGYDGIPIMQALSPRLTTIRQNSDRIGEEAASKLIAMIEEGKGVSWLPVVLPVELLEGGTVARLN